MRDNSEEATNLLTESALYREFLAEREEILRHKWIESEKAGRDIGFERALLDWVMHHRAQWKKERAAKRDPELNNQSVGDGGLHAN